MRPVRVIGVWGVLFAAAYLGCSDDEKDATSDRDSGPAGPGTGAGASVATGGGGSGGTSPGPWTGDGPITVYDGAVAIEGDAGATLYCYVTQCDSHITECGDCEDNDGDGHVDWRDQECLGPCDDTESAALTTGVGGEKGGPCKADCYFDFGNGSGNDDCYWDHQCDVLSVAPDYPPEGVDCAYEASALGSDDCPANQSTECLNICRPLTPNGCDCFGCCTFPELAGRGPDGGEGYVWLGSGLDGTVEDHQGTCTFEDILDPAACRPCTPVADCFNDCGACEVCLGRPMPPPECFPGDAGTPDGGEPPGQCDANVQPCGLAGQADCPPMTHYCVTGCCQTIVF